MTGGEGSISLVMVMIREDLFVQIMELAGDKSVESIINDMAIPLWVSMQKARNAKSVVDFIDDIRNTPLNDKQA